MPSKLTLRDKLQQWQGKKSRAKSPLGSNAPTTSGPAPPASTAQVGAGSSSSRSSTVPAPPATTRAFEKALQDHLDKLSSSEKQAFTNANQMESDELMSAISKLDETHKSSAVSRRFAGPIQTLLELVTSGLGLASIAVSANPAATLVVGGIKLMIKLSLEYFTFFEKLSKTLSEFSDHIGHLKITDSTSSKHPSHAVQVALAGVYGDLLDLCRKARLVFVEPDGTPKRYVSLRTFVRVQWEPFESAIGGINTSLVHHLNVLLHASQAQQLSILQDVQNEIKAGKRRKIMQWLSKIDMENIHENIFKQKHPGTGGWLFKKYEFAEWIIARKSSILWCFGSPGIGKSVLASSVLEEVTRLYGVDERTGIAFMYCRHDAVPEERSASSIIALFVKQLLWGTSQLPRFVEDFYQAYALDARTPLVDKYADILIKITADFEKTYIIIDALDECDEKERQVLLSQIRAITEKSHDVHVFLTSRKEEDIGRFFTSTSTPWVEIEAWDTDMDIAVFVEDKVKSLAEDGDLRVSEASNIDLIIERLVAGADGMFLWIDLQLKSLCRERNDEDILEALERLPKTLNETYLRIEQQINDRPEILQSLAMRALTWVFYAARPLYVEELLAAVSFDDKGTRKSTKKYSADDVVEACANLIRIEAADGYYNAVVRPIHYSVKEYFVNKREGGALHQRRIEPEHAHQEISTTCMRYLVMEGADHQVAKLAIHLDQFLLDRDLYVYAATKFDEHIAQLHTRSVEIEDSLGELLSAPSPTIILILEVRVMSWYRYRKLRWRTDGELLGYDRYTEDTTSSDLIYSSKLFNCRDLYLGPFLSKYGSLENLPVSRYALHSASAVGAVECVKHLLSTRQLEYVPDSEGRRPLYLAAMNGHHSTCEALLNDGKHFHDLEDEYRTVLAAAARNGHASVVKLLLENGAPVNINLSSTAFGTALGAATRSGSLNTVQVLLDYGADVNAEAGVFNTALTIACQFGNLDLVELLLDRGADPNINLPDKTAGPAITAAARQGYDDIVELLFDKGAEVNAQGGTYGSALAAACSLTETGCFQTVELLLERGADINMSVMPFGSALRVAVKSPDDEIVKLLLDHGAKVEIEVEVEVKTDEEEDQPAVPARQSEDSSSVDSDISKPAWNIMGILQLALQGVASYGSDHFPILTLLLDAGARPKYDGERLWLRRCGFNTGTWKLDDSIPCQIPGDWADRRDKMRAVYHLHEDDFDQEQWDEVEESAREGEENFSEKGSNDDSSSRDDASSVDLETSGER